MIRHFSAPNYNSIFDTETGFHARWGEAKDVDPEMAPGPEIIDMEISTACHTGCRFCYKGNKARGQNMALGTFKTILGKLPQTITQIAFGIGDLQPLDAPMWSIFDYARTQNIVPNITISGHGLSDAKAKRLASVMGAVSVSRYQPVDTCYSAIEKLASFGLKQVNIHQLVSESTYADCLQLLEDMKNDSRLVQLNAAVFLMLKPKKRGVSFNQLRDKLKYKTLVDKALEWNLPIGFDSCSVPSFLSVTKDHPNYSRFVQSTDKCESGLFSLYIDVEGNVWPCSFGQDRSDITPISMLEIKDFNEDVWQGKVMEDWRARLKATNRSCPMYDIDVK